MSQAVTLKPHLETAPTKGSIFVPALFALTLFVSATLLFLVQPMIAKMILPFLGGSPAVWNTCQVFFQAVLLVGYTYAHVSTGWMGSNKQGWLHLVLMFIPLAVLPLSLRNWEPPAGDPIGWLGWLFLLLSVSVGLPFFILSTTAPLMQKWFTETGHPSAKDPYFLYAASNVGSMLALLGYPTLVEPYIPLRGDGSTWVTQINLWAIGYCILLALLAACRLTVAMSTKVASEASDTYRVVEKTGGDPASDITSWTRLRWIGLAFVPSSLMLGITTYLTLDIAAIPLLWVIPLSIYLLTFILVFARWPRWIHEGVIALMPLVVLLIVFMLETDIKPSVQMTVYLFFGALFIVSLMCHGELARTKPAPRRLTEFYLLMSLGGVLGGMFNGLLAPLVFGDVIEHEVAMILACFLLPTLGSSTTLLTERIFGARPSKARGVVFDVLAGLFVGAALYAVLVFNATAGGGEERHPTSYKLWQFMQRSAEKTSSWIITGVNWSKRKYDLGQGWVKETIFRRPPMAVANASGEGDSPFVITPYRVKIIFMYGTLILLCYAFATRPLRFGVALVCFIVASRLYDRGLSVPYLGALPAYVNQPMYQDRSFFGVLRVDKEFDPEDDFPIHSLLHGTTLHGKQYTNPARQDDPITYYFRTGPVGLAFRGARELFPHMNIAVIGLGTGTIASYAQKGDSLTYYEIDNLVRDIATNPKYFTFLENCEKRGCKPDIIMGDARLRLKDAKEGAYDVIVVDAFSSDAIPVHLITKQAVELYLQKLAPHGYLLIHVSNRYLRLAPVVGRIAEDLGVAAVRQHDDSTSGFEQRYKTPSDWIVVTRDKADLEPLFHRQPELEQWSKTPPFVGVWPVLGFVEPTQRLQNFIRREKAIWEHLGSEKGVGLWTDDYSNLLQVLQW